MPKTRNFSDLEKRDAMDLLAIHGNIHDVHLLTGISKRTLHRWHKKLRRQQKAALAEKSFSLADIPTKPAKVETNQQPSDNAALTPDASIQPPANTQVALTDPDKVRQDLQSLRYIREQLLIFARELAGDLDPNDPDINLRTMSLSRTLERIRWLDENLYDGEANADQSHTAAPPNRIQFVIDEQTRQYPPWQDASQEDDD